jgi:hypothetical protein
VSGTSHGTRGTARPTQAKRGDDPTYKLTVTYALGHDQEHPGLTADAVEQGFVAFFHDLTYLKGAGIQRVSIEIEGERDERGGYVPGLG